MIEKLYIRSQYVGETLKCENTCSDNEPVPGAYVIGSMDRYPSTHRSIQSKADDFSAHNILVNPVYVFDSPPDESYWRLASINSDAEPSEPHSIARFVDINLPILTTVEFVEQVEHQLGLITNFRIGEIIDLTNPSLRLAS